MPAPTNPNVFDPPTAAQLAEYLASNPPIATAGWRGRLPLFVLAAVAMALLLTSGPAFALLPWLALLGFMVYLTSRVRAARELQQRVTRTWELAMIRRHREALGRAWDLLPACRTRPELHGRVVTVIAHILDELAHDQAAEVAYGYLQDRLAADNPLSLRLKVKQATAALGADRLADADEALRRLRGRAESDQDPTLAASYRMARLLQDVKTGHYADAADQADQTADALRPLGIEAGYGHGLLAYCFHQLSEHDPSADADQREQLADRAERWWRKATLLVPPSVLLYRYPELHLLQQSKHD